jgi:hypothetical protein
VVRYIQAAERFGCDRNGGDDQLSDELIGAVVAAVRPARPHGHGAACQSLVPHRDQIKTWLEAGLTLTKVADLFALSARPLVPLVGGRSRRPGSAMRHVVESTLTGGAALDAQGGSTANQRRWRSRCVTAWSRQVGWIATGFATETEPTPAIGAAATDSSGRQPPEQPAQAG